MFFQELKLPRPEKKGKSGDFSTSSEVLEELAKRGHDIATFVNECDRAGNVCELTGRMQVEVPHEAQVDLHRRPDAIHPPSLRPSPHVVLHGCDGNGKVVVGGPKPAEHSQHWGGENVERCVRGSARMDATIGGLLADR